MAPADSATIHIAPGIHWKIVAIEKPNIHLVGVSGDAAKTNAGDNKSAGTSGGTLHSARVNVRGDNLLAKNITLQNDRNNETSRTRNGRMDRSPRALLVNGGHAVFRNVGLLGNWDTPYAGSPAIRTRAGSARRHVRTFHATLPGMRPSFLAAGKRPSTLARSTARASRGFITAQSRYYPVEDSGSVFHGTAG